MKRRVALTGIGVVAPGGVGTAAFWDLMMAGRTATRLITSFDTSAFRSRTAGQCDFDPTRQGLTADDAARLDRSAQFAVVAAREALDDSALDVDGEQAHRVGVSIGTAVGCTMRLEQEYVAVSDRGSRWVVDHERSTEHLYDYFVPSSLAAEVAWLTGAEGPVTVVSAGCTSGVDAVGYAYDLISEGSADVMLAGGTDAPISPITLACFDAIKATSPRNDDPEHASRPFDRTRNGFVLAEGAAVLVLEDYDRAVRRDAHVYAEIVGFASRSNAYHMTGLRPDGREMAAAVIDTLRQARLDPSSLDYVNAHGTATKQNDVHETNALKCSLGPHAYRVPVSSIKSMIGHSLGAIGAIEIAAVALAIEHGVVPPTANLTEPDPALDLDYVPLIARDRPVRAALTVASGFGGFQSAMALSRPGGVRRE